jgi:hypothetical protein
MPYPTTNAEREMSRHALSNEPRARLNARSKEGENDGTVILRA